MMSFDCESRSDCPYERFGLLLALLRVSRWNTRDMFGRRNKTRTRREADGRSGRSGQVLSCHSNRALFTILIFKLLGSFMLFYVIYCWNEVGSGTHVHIMCNSKCHKAIVMLPAP